MDTQFILNNMQSPFLLHIITHIYIDISSTAIIGIFLMVVFVVLYIY